MDSLDTRLRGVETSLAALTRDVAHLPSKGFIISAVLAAVAVLGALITLADHVQAALGL